MTNDEKTVLVGLTAAVVGVPIILGFALHWAVWVWVLLIAVLLLIPFQVWRTIQGRRHQRELRQQAFTQQASRAELEQAPPPPFQQQPLVTVPLDSAVDDYDFLFSATVYWRPVPRPGGWQHANPAALAAQSIIGRAREVTVQEPPDRHAMAQFRLNSALGTILGDGSGFVEAWAGQVQLSLAEADLARLRKLADVRKDQDVWEHERHHERDKRTYLGEDVLKNTGSAVVWWLAHANEDVRGTVALIDTLRQLTAAANNTEVPELPSAAEAAPVEITLAGRVRGLMDGLELDEPARALFVRRLAKDMTAAGRPDAADDLLATFDQPPEPAPDEPDWTEPSPNGVADTVPEWTDRPELSS